MRYRIRLEDPNSHHFREVVTHADTEEQAIAAALRLEDKAVGYTLTDEQLAEIQNTPEADRKGSQRGALHMHGQAERYEVVSVKAGLEAPKPPTKKAIAGAEAIRAEATTDGGES